MRISNKLILEFNMSIQLNNNYQKSFWSFPLVNDTLNLINDASKIIEQNSLNLQNLTQEIIHKKKPIVGAT